MNTNVRTRAAIVAGVVIIIFIVIMTTVQVHTSGTVSSVANTPGAGASNPISSVTYSCDAGKTIAAQYFQGTSQPATAGQPPIPGGTVVAALSDGRTMTLSQTVSADGARYANPDGSFVFWNKGNGVMVLENGQQQSYTGCIAASPLPAGENLSQVYSNSADGFSVRLPSFVLAATTSSIEQPSLDPDSYTVDSSYAYQEIPGKQFDGVKFTIPSSAASGTNLSPDSYISVEEIPLAAQCSAALFFAAGTPSVVVDAGRTYSVASSSGAGAGNRYEETVYAIPGTSPCIGVRYFIHYGVIDNYPPGSVKQFDQQALVDQFDQIRRTLVINQ